MEGPIIVRQKISKDELKRLLEETFETMIKVDVDIVREIITLGGEWHSEGDDLLSKDGSLRENVWGCNFYPYRELKKRIEYISLINIKPLSEHHNMEINSTNIRSKMREIIESLLLAGGEKLDV
jgi:hypothetical protein